MTTPATTPNIRAARDKINALLDSLDPETLDLLHSGAIFDTYAEESPPPTATSNSAAPPTSEPPRKNDSGVSQRPARRTVSPENDATEADEDHHERASGPNAFTRERAWKLHCRGMRSPAIGEELDVPERTVRHWLARDREAVLAEFAGLRREQTLTAVESLRAALAAAWAAFEDERATEEEFAMAIRRSYRVRLHTPEDAESAPEPPRYPTHAARYLSLALTAQRSLVRLLGLSYTLLEDGPSVAHQPATPTPAPTLATSPTRTSAPSAVSTAPAKAAKTANTQPPAPIPAANAIIPKPSKIAASAAIPQTSEIAAKTATPMPDVATLAGAAAPHPTLLDSVPVCLQPTPEMRQQSTTATRRAQTHASIPLRTQPTAAQGRLPSLAHRRRKTAKTANAPILILPHPELSALTT